MQDKSLAERLAEMESEQSALSQRLWGQQEDTLSGSANYQAIVSILHARPILVEPCLRWLNTKLASLSLAELRQLYTDDEIAEMQAKLEG